MKLARLADPDAWPNQRYRGVPVVNGVDVAVGPGEIYRTAAVATLLVPRIRATGQSLT
jgi:hypothetical protein